MAARGAPLPTTAMLFARATLEHLPEPDIKLEAIAARQSRRRRQRHVEPDRADGRVIAHAEPDADRGPALKVVAVATHLASIHEDGAAELIREALTKLDRCGIDGVAARGLSVREARPDRLIAKATHGSAAAAVKALVRRQIEGCRAVHLADEGAQREYTAAGGGEAQLGEVEIGGRVRLRDDECRPE